MENVEERVQEFKRRLINEVGQITCDVVMMNSDKFSTYVNSLTPDQRVDLCHVLRGELLQVIFAVKEAK
jgi:hypothetical protein